MKGSRRFFSVPVVLVALCCALASVPVVAEWVAWINETSTRLSGDPATLHDDTEEKDYAWGDVDQDGDIDLVVVRKEPVTTPGKRTNVLLMNENGVLVDRTAMYAVDSSVPGDMGFLTPTNDRDVQLADVNNDGWLDIITAVTISDGDPKHIGHPRVYINQGLDGGGPNANWLGFRYEDAWIPEMLTYNGMSGFNPRFCSVAVGDVTGDDLPDLYFGDYDAGIGSPQPPDADFNDRLLINQNGQSFADETDASFRGLVQIPSSQNQPFVVSAFGAAVAIADVNGDGTNDIVKQTALTPPQYVGISYNDPNDEGFFDQHNVVAENSPYFVSVGNLNNDNLLDLVITDDGDDRYLINVGAGIGGHSIFQAQTFQFQDTSDQGFGSNSLIVDVDQDGWNDVLIADVDVDEAGCSRRMQIYHNQGGFPGDIPVLIEETDGTNCASPANLSSCLVAGIPASELTGVHDVAVFDIDEDGFNDMVIGRCDGTDVWMGAPARTILFTPPTPLPTIVDPQATTTIQIEIVPVNDTLVPGSAKLFASVEGGPFVESALTPVGGDLHEGTLPPVQACLDDLNFYFSAELTSGLIVEFPTNAPDSNFLAKGAFGTQTLISDGFEGDVSAWTVTDVLVLAGEWGQHVPNASIAAGGVQAAPGEDSEPLGIKAFITGNGIPGGGAESSDLDGGPTTLTSPVFDLTVAEGVVFYDSWAFSQGGALDVLDVEVTNDGSLWRTMQTHGPNQNFWASEGIRVADHVTPTSTMQVRFQVADYPNDSITEAGVDAFRVEAFVCTNCSVPADCDDGIFCNGVEVCNAGVCEAGGDPCPGQVCDESGDQCLDCFVDPDCNDGNFCNGVEFCSANVCLAGSDPCPGSACDETFDACVQCVMDSECDDGLFCNGAETCNGGACGPPGDACPGQTCDEAADVCLGTVTLQQRNGEPLNGLTTEQLNRFEAGKVLFSKVFSVSEGLGPIFNQDSCASCHSNPIGGSSSVLVTRFGLDDPKGGGFDPLPSLGGSLLQHSSISPSCAETIPAMANVTANRVTPTILGLGLVEAIDDADIQAAETNPPPVVSGVAHMVEPLESPGVPRVGRFGWKSQAATLLTFSGDAALNEMGLTNRLMPNENAPNGDAGLLATCDTVADPEDGPDGEGFDFIDRVTDFQRFLAPPPQTPRTGMTGETVFNDSGCASCHTPAFTTRDDPGLEDALRNKVIRPYSDFLLHDMGLNADFIEQGGAGVREIRTAPLWGVRARDPLWHDGRVAGGDFNTRMRDAIALHHSLNSEAQASKQAFDALSASEQNSVILFLDSLGRVEFDHDGDGDVDLNDHSVHQSCFTGPGQFYTPDNSCSISDVDRDGDVDDDDSQLFQTVVDADSGGVTGLLLDKVGGNLQLDWTVSCNLTDDDYAIYEGTIGGTFDDHASKLCSTAGATGESFSAPGGSAYYLVVPRNLLREGSYGQQTGGVERTAGAGACVAQAVGGCL